MLIWLKIVKKTLPFKFEYLSPPFPTEKWWIFFQFSILNCVFLQHKSIQIRTNISFKKMFKGYSRSCFFFQSLFLLFLHALGVNYWDFWTYFFGKWCIVVTHRLTDFKRIFLPDPKIIFSGDFFFASMGHLWKGLSSL